MEDILRKMSISTHLGHIHVDYLRDLERLWIREESDFIQGAV